MKLIPNIAARERKDGTQPGRAGSLLPAAEGDKMFALPASSRRRAPVLRSRTAESGQSVAPHPRLNSLRSLRSFAAIVVSLLFAGTAAHAQVNSGSDGHDGAFNPATSTVIDMADHPDGIYQYTAVNIPTNVTVTFIPNANNSPVVWLVQSNCVVSGAVNVSGQSADGQAGTAGGPGGYRGGNGGSATPGQGPGGGAVNSSHGGNASFGSVGQQYSYQGAPGVLYGNIFLLPLLGGSGGGGCSGAGAGGGGAILIASSQFIQIDGSIVASGGSASYGLYGGNGGGAGSGGAIRLVTRTLQGRGRIACSGGSCAIGAYEGSNSAGSGRIRLDYMESLFGGTLVGTVTQGFQPIIIPAAGQGIQLAIASVGGVAVAANPSGVLVTPDAIIAGQQANPIAIVVHCSNLPLNTPITVTVRPANGSSVSAVGYNNIGTQASSTATVSLNMPRGGGILYATAATGN
jgi:hypothetical protein